MATGDPGDAPPPWADQAVQAGLIHEHLTVTAPLVAQAFARECGITPVDAAASTDADAATATRVAVRDALLRDRDVAAAVAAISLRYPSLLHCDPALRFRLVQQGVVDLLAAGRWQDALAAASEQLVGCADDGEDSGGGDGGRGDGTPPPWPPQHAADVDATMALFLFDVPACAAAGGKGGGAATDLPAPLAALTSDAHRAGTADAVNVALLAAGGESTHARLPALLQQLVRQPPQPLKPPPPLGVLLAPPFAAAAGGGDDGSGGSGGGGSTRQQSAAPSRAAGPNGDYDGATGRRGAANSTSVFDDASLLTGGLRLETP